MSTDKSTIDSYNQNAYLWSGKMRSGKNYAHLFIEKPAMIDLIPNLKDKKVLALGCGSGEEVEILRSKGAEDQNIIGIDIADKLIDIAQQTYTNIEFTVMDMESLDFEESHFDFIYSSLALHYLENWEKVLNEVFRVLKKDGEFLFSTHHPLAWGAGNLENKNSLDRVIGYRKFIEYRDKIDLHGNYLTKSKGEAKWFNNAMQIKFYNRSLSEMFYELKKAGFKIQEMLEPKPLAETKEKDFKLWKIHNEIPLFVIWKVKK